MAKIVIFGAGDIARLAHFYFSTDSEHEVVAFTVDAAYRHGDTFLDLPLCRSTGWRRAYPPIVVQDVRRAQLRKDEPGPRQRSTPRPRRSATIW